MFLVGFSYFEDRLLLNDHSSGREKRTQHEKSLGGTLYTNEYEAQQGNARKYAFSRSIYSDQMALVSIFSRLFSELS